MSHSAVICTPSTARNSASMLVPRAPTPMIPTRTTERGSNFIPITLPSAGEAITSSESGEDVASLLRPRDAPVTAADLRRSRLEIFIAILLEIVHVVTNLFVLTSHSISSSNQFICSVFRASSFISHASIRNRIRNVNQFCVRGIEKYLDLILLLDKLPALYLQGQTYMHVTTLDWIIVIVSIGVSFLPALLLAKRG